MNKLHEMLLMAAVMQGDRPMGRRPRTKTKPPDHIARKAKKNVSTNSASKASRKKNR